MSNVQVSSNNLPELKFDLSDYFFNSTKSKNEVVIGERRYSLNKSNSKYVSIGLLYDYNFAPCIKLMSSKNDGIIFSEDEWKDFLSYQGIMTNYLYSNGSTDPIHAGNFTIHFEQISSARVLKITKAASYIFLGYESVCKLWELLPLLKFRTSMLKQQQFISYLKVLQKGLQGQAGNIFVIASNILKANETSPTENVCLTLEFMSVFPDEFEDYILKF